MGELGELVRRALAEDLGSGDVTSEATVAPAARARATITQKQDGVIYGVEAAIETFRALDADVVVEETGAQAAWREAGSVVVVVSGNARALLAAERTALNFLGRLSGIATLTARAVAELEGTGARLLDTRKTTPGLRALEKQAVAAGGGANHRFGLHDAILIKENHIAAAGGAAAALDAAGALDARLEIQIEVETLDQLREALAAGATNVLLDNFTVERMREAVALTAGRAVLEASGGVTFEHIRDIAATGVDRISIGALTKDVHAVDFSMRVR